MIIVGKGPSLRGKNIGSWIDGFNTVVKMTEGWQDEDYGRKCSYLVSTTMQFYEINRYDLSKVEVIWLYYTRRPRRIRSTWRGMPDAVRIRTGFLGPIVVINECISKWLSLYKQRRCHQRTIKDRVNYPSKGTAAILAAMYLTNEKIIYAVGFDCVLMGGKQSCLTHDWIIEHRLIKECAAERGVKIVSV